ncbi:FAD binding domain-containing protein [Actinokineospora soli]|uniref:FAD binding domain-containing protein n=1 Tax=Actinokineospora soli TaxID=1048753 RepID=A0ABW2TXP2_9PSEU
MIPAEFDYVAPTTLDDAVRALADAGEDAKIIAGGQSLLPVLRMRLATPPKLVDLARVAELHGIREDGDRIVIGAMTTHYELQRDPLVADHLALLRLATDTVADPQVRHRGTLGGALAHADPAGDLAAPALALDAEFTVCGMDGKRTIPASDFFVDYFTTALRPDEIISEIRFPKHTNCHAHYEKFTRVAQAWSIVAVGACLQVTDGTITDARIALTNMAPVPLRATTVEAALVGNPITPETLRTAAAHAADHTTPTTDSNADRDYRHHLARVLTTRALTAAAGA